MPLTARLATAAQYRASNRELSALLREAHDRLVELEAVEGRIKRMMRTERYDAGWNRHLIFLLEGN